MPGATPAEPLTLGQGRAILIPNAPEFISGVHIDFALPA